VYEFPIGLRGYERHRVDALIARAQTALESGTPADRHQIAAEIESGGLPVALRGYDRGAVDDALHRLAATLASA
jgi:DivIVA domain-containing protein